MNVDRDLKKIIWLPMPKVQDFKGKVFRCQGTGSCVAEVDDPVVSRSVSVISTFINLHIRLAKPKAQDFKVKVRYLFRCQ
jgi:hypothetical protein